MDPHGAFVDRPTKRRLTCGTSILKFYDELTQAGHAIESLAAANTASIPVKWWKAITVSYVLLRRRLHIVPLTDTRVHEFYGAKTRLPMRKGRTGHTDWLKELAMPRSALGHCHSSVWLTF